MTTAEQVTNAAWLRALTLRERPRVDGAPIDPELAARRLRCWRAQAPFTDAEIWSQRLRADGFAAETFLALLGEPSRHLVTRIDDAPEWVTELLAAYGHPHSMPDRWRDELAILAAAEPLLERGRARVLEVARGVARDGAPFDPDAIVPRLEAVLPARLFPILARTVAHELQAASRAGALPGDTPEERFRVFVDYLAAEGGVLDLFEAYPVMARQVTMCVSQWADSSTEFLARLASEADVIARALGAGADPGRVVSVAGGVSDPHGRGREVLIVGFESGLRVVYKPKPLAVDVHFQHLLEWLNARGLRPPLRRIGIVDRGEYGWVEFVQARSCASAAEVERFYQRQGSLLAILHVLAATDLHFENLIAAGEDPILIDLEALFHPSLRAIAPGTAFEKVLASMETSVLAVGMLPQPLRLNPKGEAVDVSALGMGEAQLSPRGVARWVGGATDTARIEYERVPVGGVQHRPTLDRRPQDVLEYSDALLSGFGHTYELLAACSSELLDEDGPLAAFARDTARLLLRPTVVYARMLGESFHPDLLRDALERDRFFDRLWVAVPNQPRLIPAIAAEQDDLWHGDIPRFTAQPGSHLVMSGAGTPIGGVIEQSGFEVVHQRLAALGPDDLERQRWFIQAALGSLPGAAEPGLEPARSVASRPATREDLLDGARRVARRLSHLAVRGTDDATWIGLSNSSVVPLGADLYAGLPGVLLFLATLGDAGSIELARAGLRRLEHQLADGLAPLDTIGAFSGWGGLIYAYTHLASLLEEPGPLEAAHAIVLEQLPGLIATDDRFDISDGAAGCVGALAALYTVDARPSVLAAAVACGERLLDHAPTLTGFAHGAAGHAWALEKLFTLTGQSRFAEAARRARTWEDRLYSADVRNWPDLRLPGGQRFMLAWCHGAAGIGLSRPEPRAARAVRSAPPRPNHSLCHGELGNLELLPLDEARARATAVLAAPDWICATPFGIESPGLMTGLAGIGYGLLRLAEPERVPSVLTLEPPRGRG
jgi:type 2 lantibiotic biosynthesis protein LanM